MIEEFGLATAAAAAPGHHRARRRHRAARSRAGSGRPARGVARPVAHVSTTISSSSRPACCSTTPSIAGAATRPARRTTGRPTRRSRNGCDDRARRPKPMPHARSRHQLRRSLPRLAAGRALSFGGPAGQIAVMHRILVEEKSWISREPVPACAELLHAAAGPGGAAARDLYRLAAAPDRAAASSPAACSSCPASSPSWR